MRIALPTGVIAALALTLSACAAGDADEPATTPDPEETMAVEAAPEPEPEPVTSEEPVPEEPAESTYEITRVPFYEPFILTGPDVEETPDNLEDIDFTAPHSTWEFQFEGHIEANMDREGMDEDNMPGCPVSWGTATLLKAAEGGADAPPPGIMIMGLEGDGSWPETPTFAEGNYDLPAGYEIVYFTDGERIAVGETYKFAITSSVLDDLEDPVLLAVLENSGEQVYLEPPA